jgi:hypothetical protein
VLCVSKARESSRCRRESRVQCQTRFNNCKLTQTLRNCRHSRGIVERHRIDHAVVVRRHRHASVYRRRHRDRDLAMLNPRHTIRRLVTCQRVALAHQPDPVRRNRTQIAAARRSRTATSRLTVLEVSSIRSRSSGTKSIVRDFSTDFSYSVRRFALAQHETRPKSISE